MSFCTRAALRYCQAWHTHVLLLAAPVLQSPQLPSSTAPHRSPLMGWLPVEQKALVRKILRAQQQASEEAAQKAAEEEEQVEVARLKRLGQAA